MAKYSAELKLQITLEAIQSKTSLISLARKYGVDSAALRYWLQRYQYHGTQAFEKKHSKYSAKFKQQVLAHMEQHQLSLRETVAYFDIRGGAGVVSRWRRLYDLEGLIALESKPKGRPPTMSTSSRKTPSSSTLTSSQELTQLRKENEYLRAENAYLKKLDALLQQKELAQKTGRLPKKKRK